jgi:hypothetical protein
MIEVGTVFKNTKHHPSRLFVVEKTRSLNSTIRRVRGKVISPSGEIIEENFTPDELKNIFPFILWVPPGRN